MHLKTKNKLLIVFATIAVAFSCVFGFSLSANTVPKAQAQTPTATESAKTPAAGESENENESAQKTPAVTIKTYNLSYSESIYILYAVQPSNFNADEHEIKMLFYNGTKTDYSVDNADYVATAEKNSLIMGGLTYKVFYSKGLAAKNMTDDVYSRAYVEIDGTIYYSNVAKFSVLEYIHTMLDRDKDDDQSNNLTDAQRELFSSLLNYGAAAQKTFKHNVDRLANDVYYKLTVSNGTLSDGFTKGRYKTGEKVTVTANEPPEGKLFSHWVDNDGIIVGMESEFEITIGNKDVLLEAIFKEVIDLGNTIKLTAEVNYNETAEDINLPETVTVIYNKQTVELPVSWNSEYFIEKQIGTQTLIGTLKNTDDYATYGITPGGITIEITTLPYALTLNSQKTAYTYDSYYGTESEITLPAKYKGLPVNAIGSSAFNGNNVLTSITIPNTYVSIGSNAFSNCKLLSTINGGDAIKTIGSEAFYQCKGLSALQLGKCVTTIGDSAFYNCYNLQSVAFNDNLERIGNSAFYNCYKLASVTIGANVTFIGGAAFYYCRGLNGELVIPDSVTSIGGGAFYGCSGLTSVTIPDSVTSIGDYAFQYCSGLTSVTIGNGVTSIGEEAFSGCSNLENIYITDVAAWCNISGLSNLMYYGSSNKKLYLNNELITDLVIPDGVTSIDSYAFFYCSGLTSVTIGNGVTSIGDWAFDGCSGLTSVTIPDSVTSIGDYAFWNCSGLTSVTIPDSVTSIGEEAFYGCSGLTSVTIGNGVTSIADSAFDGCSGLTNVTIGNGVTSIGQGAFSNCSGLTSVTIPDSVTSIVMERSGIAAGLLKSNLTAPLPSGTL